MRNFQDTFEHFVRSFISAFSICMTLPLINLALNNKYFFFGKWFIIHNSCLEKLLSALILFLLGGM